MGRLHNGEGGRLQRLQNSGQTEGPADGHVRTSTPADGEDRASQVGVESFLRFSGREEEELEERRRLREQASRDRDRRPPGQDRREDGNRLHSSSGAPLLARQLGGGEREGREQLQPAYLHKFPRLRRSKAKIEADRSSLNGIVEDIVQEGCNKRKAELI